MSLPVLELRDILVRYGPSVVLRVPSLTLFSGEILALIGPNGAGKSTLLRVMGLLEAPSQGELYFSGQRVLWNADILYFRRRMASVFQEPLLCDTTVFENVALGLRLRGASRREILDKVGWWLERLGIAALASQQARTLSGGEAQRASLARAFVIDPEVLLLDEPFAALDPPTRESLLFDLDAILRETGTTTLFVTHERSEALLLGDRLGVMMGGEVLQLDLPERVFATPATEEVARFVGVETILPGKVISQERGLAVVGLGGTELEVLAEHSPGERVLVCLRPEDITLSRKEDPISDPSAGNRIYGRVRRLAPLGSQYRVVVDCGFPLVALITKQSYWELSLKEGTEVIASFKASAAHVLKKH